MAVNAAQVGIMNEAIDRIVRQSAAWCSVPPDVKFGHASLRDVVEFAIVAFTGEWPAILRQLNTVGDRIGAWPEHTCHDMNPPFPGPCRACEFERSSEESA
jgi:hypothetical protein